MMGVLETLILTTALAGVVGTGLGGVLGALLQKDSNRTASLLLSFAGGVMLSVVCFDLITESIETNVGVWPVIGSVALGVALIFLLNHLIDRRVNPQVKHIDESHPKTADDLDELIHSDHLHHHRANKDNKFALFMAGVVMACAIALHNMPEGMTIGASYASNNGVMGSAALVLAILIGLHNIPEGMAVSVPLISGGMKKGDVLTVAQIAGVMLESFLVAGAQKLDPEKLKINGGEGLVYGQSVTDACMDMDTTAELLSELAAAVRERRQARV